MAVTSRAVEIPIINPSFEETSRPLAVGEQTNGAGGVGVPVGTWMPFVFGPVDWSDPVEVPGWRTVLPPFGDPATIYAGVLNPPEVSPGVPFITGQDGDYIVAAQVSAMQQTLSTQVAPDTRYRLSFRGGIGNGDFDYILPVALLAAPNQEMLAFNGSPGVTTLAITQSLMPPSKLIGTMQTYWIEYISPDVLPPNLVDHYLVVYFVGSDGIPRGCYDDFSLQAWPAPCTFNINDAGGIDFADAIIQIDSLGIASGALFDDGDLDADADVDIRDFATLQANFGYPCP